MSVHISETTSSHNSATIPTMGEDDVISETQKRLEARLAELRPAVEEDAKIEAALAALKNGPRPPVTVLDTLRPVPPADGSS
jgi:hypothetical protein